MALCPMAVVRWLHLRSKAHRLLIKKLKAMETCSVNLGALRAPYRESEDIFFEQTLPCREPIGLFSQWFDLACNTPVIKEPNAMVLATADKNGRPSARFVLLKGFGKDGFKFFTNYNSRKGKELAENPYAALAFHWQVLSRQTDVELLCLTNIWTKVRIEGPVEKLSEKESEEYFHLRPKDAQVSGMISDQSTVIPSREFLLQKHVVAKKKYEGKTVPKPDCWGGYIVKPEVIEFWQGQTNRLHDRIRFSYQPNKTANGDTVNVGEDGWIYERLSP